MYAIPVISMLVIILMILVGVIAAGLRKGASGTKIMLLGLSITMFGGIIAVDPDSNLGGIEYLIALIGLVISAIGLGKKD